MKKNHMDNKPGLGQKVSTQMSGANHWQLQSLCGIGIWAGVSKGEQVANWQAPAYLEEAALRMAVGIGKICLFW